MKKRKGILILCFALALAMLPGCGSAAEKSGEPVQLIYMGDPQSDPDNTYDYAAWGELLTGALTEAPEAETLLLGGDLINEETDEQERSAFMEAFADAKCEIPVRCVSGNHTEDNDAWVEVFQLPANGPEGYESLFYSFDIGCVHILMMDSQSMGSQEGAVQQLLTDWVRSDLKNTDKAWKIAVMHHPMYPINQRVRDQDRAETMQQIYLPILEEESVELILCGHQHVYGRTKPMLSGEISGKAKDGIVEVMGVSGGKLYSAEEADFIDHLYEEGPVYTVLSADGNSLEGKTINAAGEIVDTFTLEK